MEKNELDDLAEKAIRRAGREELKQKLRDRTPAAPLATTSFFQKWKLVLGGLLVLAGAFFWWKNNDPKSTPPIENQQPANPELQNAPVKIDPKTPVAETHPEKFPEKPGPKMDGKKLFAAHFQTFKSDEISGMVRAENEDGEFQKMLSAYLKNDHGAALQFFEKLPAEDKFNENVLFLKANSLLATNQTDAAILILEKICDDITSRFLAAAQWYLALAYLKNGQKREAEMELKFIKTANGHPFSARAGQILNEN